MADFPAEQRDTTRDDEQPDTDPLPPILLPRLRTTPYLFAQWLKERGRSTATIRLHHATDGDRWIFWVPQPGVASLRPEARAADRMSLNMVGRHMGPASMARGQILDVVRLDVLRLGAETVQVTGVCQDRQFLGSFLYLLEDIAVAWPEARAAVDDYVKAVDDSPGRSLRAGSDLQQGKPESRLAPDDIDSEHRGGLTEKTKLRAELYKRIKDEHPAWSYAKVGLEANRRDDNVNHTEDTVRNTYRRMRWTWKRSDRAR